MTAVGYLSQHHKAEPTLTGTVLPIFLTCGDDNSGLFKRHTLCKLRPRGWGSAWSYGCTQQIAHLTQLWCLSFEHLPFPLLLSSGPCIISCSEHRWHV